jgi:hypothetical protein
MPNPTIVKAALRRFFSAGSGASWQALLRQQRDNRRQAAPSRADFADTLPGVFRSEGFAEDLYDIQLAR